MSFCEFTKKLSFSNIFLISINRPGKQTWLLGALVTSEWPGPFLYMLPTDRARRASLGSSSSFFSPRNVFQDEKLSREPFFLQSTCECPPSRSILGSWAHHFFLFSGIKKKAAWSALHHLRGLYIFRTTRSRDLELLFYHHHGKKR